LRVARLQNARNWNQNGESQSDIDGEFADQSISRTLRVRIFLNDGCEVKAFTAKVAKKGRKGRQARPHS